ncbi:MAG: signal peptidase II [Magnetococcales bacterium]|nr:signal peptidase II [Magnetococcales bacterium]
MTGRGLVIGVPLALLVVVLDQASKWIVMRDLPAQGVTLIPGFFDLVLVHNVGAAFSMFATLAPDTRVWFLCSVAVVAVGAILYLLPRADSLLYILGLGLVLGGAVGNLIDRVRYGWVVDFIHVHWHELSWPVFNLADSAITVGVGLLLFDHLTTSAPADS